MERIFHLGNRILADSIQKKARHSHAGGNPLKDLNSSSSSVMYKIFSGFRLKAGMTKEKSSEKGFILTLLLISLPVFLGCLMVFTSLLFCIRNHDLTQTICLTHTLQAQEQMKKALRNLLLLNPLANQLRQTQKHLQQLYRKALKTGEPVTITMLRTKIEIIKQKRIFLDRKQKHILNGTMRNVESAFHAFRKKMKPFNPSYINKEHHQPIPLAVVGKPKGDVAPVYYPVSDFSSHQTFSLSWKMQLYRFLPKWLTQTFFQNQLSSYDCAATIKKSEQMWKTTFTSQVLRK